MSDNHSRLSGRGLCISEEMFLETGNFVGGLRRVVDESKEEGRIRGKFRQRKI